MAYIKDGRKIGIKRTVFISHFREDKVEVDAFIQKFCHEENVFIPRVLGANENDNFIDSYNTDYVMTQIRQNYLNDSTVTIVLIGSCSHSRRYIDWELKTSLRQGTYTPNGVVGIILPSKGKSAYFPERLASNWKEGNTDCYAKVWIYPSTAESLHNYIEDAFSARVSRKHLISNSQNMMKRNKKCNVCEITH
jgi:hypothetical protein